LKTCEVLCKFSNEQVGNIEKNFSDKEIIFVTDSQVIKSSISNLGYQIINLDLGLDYGYYSTESIDFTNRHIQHIKEFTDKFAELEYLGINLADSQKFYTFRELRILQWTEDILNKYEKIVFLFQSYSWIYFSIIELAKNLGFISEFGVAEILNDEITSIEFEDKGMGRYKSLSDSIYSNHENTDFYLFSEKFIDNIITRSGNPAHLFFIQTNLYDINARSMWPVLHKLQKMNEEHLIIPYSQQTRDKVLEKGFTNFEIFDKLNRLPTKEIPPLELKLVLDFFNKVKNTSWENPLLRSYSKYMLDNRKILQLSLTLLKINFFDHFFKKLNLKSIVISSSSTPDFDLICKIAKKNNTHTFQIPTPRLTYDLRHTFFFCASTICVSGPKIEQNLISQGIDKNRIKIIGEPIYDYISNLTKKKNQIKTQNQNKLIVVATSRWKNSDHEWISQLIHYCNQNHYDILIKPHPAYRVSLDWKAQNDHQADKITKKCKGLEFKISAEGEFHDIILQTELIITDGGTTGIEATLADIPLIISTIERKGLEWSSGQSFMDEGIALHATNIKELLENIEKIMNDKDTQNLLHESRQKFQSNFNYLNDGKAADRFAQAILNK